LERNDDDLEDDDREDVLDMHICGSGSISMRGSPP
jgi:hypothetical protein